MKLVIILLTTLTVLIHPTLVLAAPPALKFESFNPTQSRVTPPNAPEPESCSANLTVGSNAMEDWFNDSLNRIWLFTGGLGGSAPNQTDWVNEKRELYLGASQTLFGARSAFMARAILKLQITMNYPGRPAPVGRVQIPIGTVVNETQFVESYRKTYDLLAALPCNERVAFIQPSTGTPLFVYASEPTPLTIRSQNQKLFSGTVYPDSILLDTTGKQIRHIDNELIIERIPPVNRYQFVSGAELPGALATLYDTLALSSLERDVYSNYLQKKIPHASGYLLSFYPDQLARVLVPLTISPAPSHSYRFILYVKPLLEPTTYNRSATLIPPPIVTRQGLTVVDLAVLIDW